MEGNEKDGVILRVGACSFGGSSGKAAGARLEEIARDILSNELDLVGLQGVDIGCARTDFLHMPQWLSEYTGYEYYYYVECVSLYEKDGTRGSCGDCILSKYPITKNRNALLEHGGREPRALSYVQVDANGVMIHCYNTRLGYKGRERNGDLRLTQLEQVAGQIQETPQCILVGDFHITTEEQCRAMPGFHSVRSTGEERQKTGLLRTNILYSEGFRLVSSGVSEGGVVCVQLEGLR